MKFGDESTNYIIQWSSLGRDGNGSWLKVLTQTRSITDFKVWNTTMRYLKFDLLLVDNNRLRTAEVQRRHLSKSVKIVSEMVSVHHALHDAVKETSIPQVHESLKKIPCVASGSNHAKKKIVYSRER